MRPFVTSLRLSLLLGWRSFVRHRRRSAITSAAISLSLAMMLVFVGIADDAHIRMAEIGIRLGAGNVLIQGRGYQQEQTLDKLVAQPAQVAARARALPQVSATAVRLRSSGLISAGELSSAVLVSGVEPAVEPAVSTIASAEHRVRGDFLRSRAQMPFQNAPLDIYMGQRLAEELQVDVGDRVVLTVSPRGASEPASAAFRVRGLFRTGLSDLDGGYAQIPLEEAQRLLEVGDAASQVAVLLDDLDRSDATAAALSITFAPPAGSGDGGIEVLSWKVALRELHEAIVLDDMGLYLMMAIVFIIVAIGIFNMMLMSVTERTRELGVMMAVGTSRWRLLSILMAEAALLALVSALIGLALGVGGHLLIASQGIDVTALAGGEYEFAGIAFSGKIYSRLTPAVAAKWTLVVVGLVVASALVPAWRAMRLRPVEAMRHV